MTLHEAERLQETIAQLRSTDVLLQNQGVETAVAMGSAALPALLPLLQEASADVRSQAMFALAQIGAVTTVAAFRQGLEDPDERVRAYAAQGLIAIDHPDGLAACIATLNDAADLLHQDMTPAVHALGTLGLLAVPALLTLMMHPNITTRLHGQRALELVVNRHYGWQPGRGYPDTESETEVRRLWGQNGAYAFDAPVSSRVQAITHWRRWLAAQADVQ